MRQAADELLLVLVEELDEAVLEAGAVEDDDVVAAAGFAGLLLDEVPRLSLR
ncbi:hypothetical protein GCM10010357_24950 [Streptomyces luteireticuli]|uniref:Acyl carrier protein n=1 Tax=Streptomyces luteireticuli TaxID=173858 RepID=A0ABN0YNR3_9ACTN